MTSKSCPITPPDASSGSATSRPNGGYRGNHFTDKQTAKENKQENWKKEAEFVLARLADNDEQLFTDNEGKPVPRTNHDEFVEKWGFSYNDIWDLDKTIVMFILPRMAYYRDHCTGYPSDFAEVAEDGFTVLNEEEAAENWNHILDTICEGLHCYLEKDFDESEEKHEKWNAAQKFLFDYFIMSEN